MLSCLHNLFQSRIRLSIGNVLADGSCLQPGLLKHHTKVSSQAVSCQLSYRITAYLNLSLIYIIESHKKVDHSGLTASGRSDDGDPLSRFYVNGNISKKRNFFSVRKGNTLHAYTAVCFLQLPSIWRIWLLCRCINKVKETFCTCQRILQLCDNAGNLIKRLGILICIVQEAGQLSHSHTALNYCKCTKNSNCCVNKAIYKTCGRVCNRGKENRFDSADAKLLIYFSKSFIGSLLIGKSLHDLLISNKLFHNRSHLRSLLGLLLEHAEGSACNKACHKQGNRSKQNDDHCNLHTDGKHKSNGSKDGQHTGKQLGKAHKETI